MQKARDGAPVTRMFGPGAGVPNNPDLPVVLLPGAFPQGLGAEAIRTRLTDNGWRGTWTWTVFDYHHFHPDAHEVLAVAAGWAELRLGGEEGETFRLGEGDVVVLPAGTGHRRLEASADFAVCGAYPPGQENYATCRAGEMPLPEAAARIAEVARPATDPAHGAGGPLTDLWAETS